jgi:hypothetical protein
MNPRVLPLFTISVLVLSGMTLADPSPPETIRHPEAGCVVEKSGGEYPLYVVKAGEEVMYSPESDGIIAALFSPSGRYIAFSGSEIAWVDIGDEYFSVVVLECQSGDLRGIRKGYPSGEESLGLSWLNDTTLRYLDTHSEKEILLEISDEPKGSLSISVKASSEE